jgi:hypothetical protein
MKKNVLIFGLISGLLITTMMVVSVGMCYRKGDFRGNEVLGYTGMLVAFSFIFVGIKNYRDKYNNGAITFGKAFKTGLLITLVASTLYVLVWLIDYYLFIPDFMDKYCTHVINMSREDGATSVELARKNEQMQTFAKLYENPLFVILFTYIEVFPIGLIVSIISALILKREPRNPAVAMAA